MAVAAENRRLSEREAVLTLLFDLCQLGALLYLTGGLEQPVRAPDHGAGDDQRLGADAARDASLLAVAAAVIITLLAALLRAARARVGRGARAAARCWRSGAGRRC